MSSDSNELQWVYGFHAVESILKHQTKRVQQLVLQDSRDDERLRGLVALAERYKVPVVQASKAELAAQIEGNHQGVLARCVPAQVRGEQELDSFLGAIEGSALLLVLDGITDPHNLGACLRSAEAAGAHAVIIPKDKSATLNATVRKVACGAAELIPVFRVGNLARCMRQLKQAGVWLTGLCGEASSSIYQTDLTMATAIVMGAEGKGLRQLSRRECDYLAVIPMPGSMESLNVSVAAGVCLFEASRQRSET
ncbi:MAG: 23S rRNA (guanosine(2251)-2'-O)-methyltransferase RlmB [Pseudomonadales bacterium]